MRIHIPQEIAKQAESELAQLAALISEVVKNSAPTVHVAHPVPESLGLVAVLVRYYGPAALVAAAVLIGELLRH